ncbi:winged helix-turn-helix transcriptional regulator [Candidatus Bipolaricaulota bacterium]|nr:winged helix-turn-helix transcriptional regulator [Candidatus Bipolaricaulota bacterium]
MHRLFKVLGSEQRLKLLSHLLQVDGPICYCELEGVINRDRSVIYRHLKKMEEVGLLKTERAGKRVECEVRDEEKVRNLLTLAKELTQSEVN